MISRNYIEKLEFDKVLNSIKKFAVTDPGKSYVQSLSPELNYSQLLEQFGLIKEITVLHHNNLQLPIEFHADIREDIQLSSVDGMILKSEKILQIARLLQNTRTLKKFVSGNAENISLLRDVVELLQPNQTLEHHIQSIISDLGEVKDSASRWLKELRTDIQRKNRELSQLFERLKKVYTEEALIRDEYYTIREGRLVLPVKAEYKRQIKGFIHSESSTGQTVYIEPQEALNYNNELISLMYAEKREVERILLELSAKIGEFSSELKSNLRIIAQLDSLQARVLYSGKINGVTPVLQKNPALTLLNGKNPLLLESIGYEQTVPVSIDFSSCKTIIISGPNAGGKTAALKTAGLLLLMVKSGIQIPVDPDSVFGFFESLYIEIGDNQSIEDNLSTFSSHLKNLNHIVSHADSTSLVLLDEVGNGTEPNAGAGLAAAVLKNLIDKGSYTLATTHYAKLKSLSDTDPRIQNAGFDFDIHTLKPTYSLHQGLPGLSYAFELAQKIGFDDRIVQDARDYTGTEMTASEDLLIQIKILQNKVTEGERKNSIRASQLAGLEKLYASKVAEIEKKKEEILQKSREQAARLVEKTKSEMNAVIKELKEAKAERAAVRQAIQKTDQTLQEIKEKSGQQNKAPQAEIKIGNTVKVSGTETIGKIIEFDPVKKRVTLLSGNLRLDAEYGALESIEQKNGEGSKSYSKETFNDITEAAYRLDIRGRRGEEVKKDIISFIDNAYINRMQQVEILHGKGTGVLKSVVKEILSEHNGVSKFYFAPADIGGDGITIVEFV